MTQSLEDYLETVYLLISEGKPAQVRDIAKSMDVTMPPVVKAMRELAKLALITHEPYQDIALTVKGRRLARMVLNRHELLRSFLLQLGVSRRMADRDACLMEHILSAETIDRIRVFTEKSKSK